jgi:CO/xanthine dehydrogenase FAD-binding subunit
MKPRPFDYVRPDCVDEAVALLAEYGDEGRVLAGGNRCWRCSTSVSPIRRL